MSRQQEQVIFQIFAYNSYTSCNLEFNPSVPRVKNVMTMAMANVCIFIVFSSIFIFVIIII